MAAVEQPVAAVAASSAADRKQELERIVGLPRSIHFGNSVKYVRISTIEDVTPRKLEAFRSALSSSGASIGWWPSSQLTKKAFMCWCMTEVQCTQQAHNNCAVLSPMSLAHYVSRVILQACMKVKWTVTKGCAKGARTWNYWKKVREASWIWS
jgi:hypothetical protein